MATKPRPSKPVEKPEVARWRIMRGRQEVESYASEEMARLRFRSLSQSTAGNFELKLIRPDGTEA